MMQFLERVHAGARRAAATIILAEPEDSRIISATAIVERKGLATVLLVGNQKKIEALAKKSKVKIRASIIDPATYSGIERFAKELVMLRRHKGMVLEEARALLKSDTKYFAAMLVKSKAADGYVAGNLCPTSETVRPALQVLGTTTGFASSHMIILHKKEIYLFADCGLNPDPTAEQLAMIGVQTAQSALGYGLKPRLAFLSFSTKGSARHERVAKVQLATQIAKERLKVPIDGELQFDAAFDPEVAKTKARSSPIAGKANVFIFPDLDSGNIAYKIAQRMAGAHVIGPILQGLKQPANDLSRGCTVQEIVDAIAITALQVRR